ncbi:cytochrome c-type biogenesis protein CcsB [Wenyingzhuangia heitensis]|uniref:Cytochrome c-type biogenesis protein CcsB n=1 Tax=Wenyingzhuangia heitensis TaxID=1487859 RepID=A0ABX0UBT2_9FLAO|nr:cytochrome c biogenesis protein CcsA [Wenyingzhuangia heitensis]NIJ44936.1 cytochrome c-type biogenesis protein CcsB [Wenyingzhuangia heitensis]
MKKIWNLIYSTRLMAVLFIAFGTAMAIATFIENDYGTETSKALVYNTWWFEAIMALFVVNFLGNIFKYRLYKRAKWAVLLFHLSFLLIIIGAAVTRYISYEGVMPILEGEKSNVFFSEKTYLNLNFHNFKEEKNVHAPILLSAKGKASYHFSTDFRGQEIDIELTDYIPNAKTEFTKSEIGDQYIHFVESSSGSRHDHYIKKGEIENIHGVLVGYENGKETSVNFTEVDGELYLESKHNGTFMRMADRFNGEIVKGETQKFNYLSLHQIAGLSFVVPEKPITGEMKVISAKDKKSFPEAMLTLKVTSKDKMTLVQVKGGQYTSNKPVPFTLADLNFNVSYGSRMLELPFYIKLNDFQLEKYPGSESAASYASEITLIDEKDNNTFDFRIFMNHILNYKGYKFFQSSYDLSGPKEETRLSVNHDAAGTIITYIGYFSLYAGLLLTLFMKETRFGQLSKRLNKLKNKTTVIALLFGLMTSFGFAQEHNHDEHDHEGHNHEAHNHAEHSEETTSTAQKVMTPEEVKAAILKYAVKPEHALEFSKLVIQDAGGRMKPINTFASELLRKVSKKDTYNDLDANQVFLSMVENPRMWYEAPIIYLEKKDTKIRTILGVNQDTKYAALSNFIDPSGNYKLTSYVADAEKNQKKSAFEKDVINIDKRVGLLYTAISGSIMRIFPKMNDNNNKWVSQLELSTAGFTGIDSVFVKQIIPAYRQTLWQAKNSGNYAEANEILGGIKNFQKKYGAEVYPSEKKIDFEITYNKYDIFKKLFSYYMYISALLFLFIIVQIFKDGKGIKLVIKGSIGIVIFLFALQTAGLGVRWFISGHAPWSDAYESIIYVAWATMLFGLIFGRKSSLTIAATAFVASMILMIAHWNWMDPQIANLQPVLNSYWLMIHVAIIVASYGPFTLSMILGLVALILMILTTDKNKKSLKHKIDELTIINEMSMTVGVIMLTIGNFLGGMWANESWGRYWGWDPKETWALISIMVYAFVLHMRLVPGLRSKFTFNIVSIYAFASIMMTYFGVNFYLSGLHSYASGDQVVTPNFVYYSVGIVAVIGVLAYLKFKKYYKK